MTVVTKFSNKFWDTTAPSAPCCLLLEPGGDLDRTPSHQHFVIQSNTPSAWSNHTQSLKHSVIMHSWGGLIYLHSMERERERERSLFPQDKDFLWFVRPLHVEMGVTITISEIFSEIIVFSLKV